MLMPGDLVRVKRLDEILPIDFKPEDVRFLEYDSCYGIGEDVLEQLAAQGPFEVTVTTSDGRVYLKGSGFGFLEPMLEPCAEDSADKFERIDEEAFFAEMFER